MLIRISGRAEVTADSGEPAPPEAALQELDGATSEGACSEYLDPDLADLGLTGGKVKLVREAGAAEFRVVTEYTSPKKLKPAQLKRLADQTVGQWSDGIGEGCFDDYADRLEVTIDLSPYIDPDLKVEQIDDGVKVPRAKTALIKAVRENDLEAVRKHLDKGADPEARVQGDTALHVAVLYGHVDIALELIARGADVNALDNTGTDALLTAAMSNSMSDEGAARVARALLERGVDPARVRVGKPGWGVNYTPLYMAKNRKKTKLAMVLREFGAKE